MIVAAKMRERYSRGEGHVSFSFKLNCGFRSFCFVGDDVRVSEAMPGTQEPFTPSGFLIVEKLQPEQAAATIYVLE